MPHCKTSKEGAVCNLRGREFHEPGATTEKALFLALTSNADGTYRSAIPIEVPPTEGPSSITRKNETDIGCLLDILAPSYLRF